MTTSLCLSLLLSGGPNVGIASPAEQTAAIEWLQMRNVLSPSGQQAEDIHRQWQIWKSTTAAARDANLALELRQIGVENSAVVQLNSRDQLRQLSKSNLERLQKQFAAMHPLPANFPQGAMADAKRIAKSFRFHYLHKYEHILETGVHTPLASSRELSKLGLDFAPPYYSKLVGQSPSVPFSVLAAGGKGPHYINARVHQDALRLNDEMARDEGFFVPNFSNPLSLLNFFEQWLPGSVEQIFLQARFSLPPTVDSLETFRLYLDPVRVNQIYPDDKAYDRLALLRTKLYLFVLTEPDMQAFLRSAFLHYALHLAATDEGSFRDLKFEMDFPAGAQNVFNNRFLPFLNFADLALRVPLAVGPQSYSVLRIEPHAYRPFPDYANPRQRPWDSRRLDHNSKP